jgi:hypothetical protein
MLSSYANQSGLVPEEEDSMEFTPGKLCSVMFGFFQKFQVYSPISHSF